MIDNLTVFFTLLESASHFKYEIYFMALTLENGYSRTVFKKQIKLFSRKKIDKKWAQIAIWIYFHFLCGKQAHLLQFMAIDV